MTEGPVPHDEITREVVLLTVGKEVRVPLAKHMIFVLVPLVIPMLVFPSLE
jgi:hypothetical protein